MSFKRFLIVSSSLVLFLFSIAYLGILFVVPAIVNTETFANKLEDFILNKTNFDTNIEDLRISVSPKLVTKINCSEIKLLDENKTVASINNISTNFDLKKFSLKDIDINNFYVNLELLRDNLSKFQKEKSKTSFDIAKIPDIKIKNTDILLNSKTKQQLMLQGFEIKSSNDKKKTINFVTVYEIPKISQQIILGQKGYLYVKNNELFAENFQLNYNNSLFNLNGKIYGKNSEHDLSLTARNIPVKQAMAVILYYQKLQDNNKKFIENFSDYDGRINLDLQIKDKKPEGFLEAKNLSANSVLFNVPIFFKDAKFVLKNDILTSEALGILGGERVSHTLLITDITSPKRKVVGKVKSTLTANQIKKYLPKEYTLKNSADAKVIYIIQNKVPEIEYFLDLKEGSDLIYKDAYLGLHNKERLLYAKTIKTETGLKLDKYEYSIISPKEKTPIILGDGFFVKQNGKLTPQFVTCRTGGYAPTYVTGAFGKYIEGGEFKGNLKYDFIKDKITGNFEIINAVFNKFFVKSANVQADTNAINITAQGEYKNQYFDCKLAAQNRLDGMFIVNDMKLFMDKFILIREKKSHAFGTENHNKAFRLHKNIDKVSSEIRKVDITIENWNILVKEFMVDNMLINNLQLFGSLKESIFNFTVSDIFFADGLLSAKGKYNFNNNSSNINLSANNINANQVATEMFNLPNQIQGIANAKLNVETFNNFQELIAKGNFDMKDGFLPQLGNTEFMLGRSNKKRKVKMYDLTNIDFSKIETLSSDIKGSFELHNYNLENINITSQQRFLSLFIDGDYDILSQEAILNIYGQYDMDAPKGIRVLFIPLNWILKLAFRPEESRQLYQSQLDKIPAVESKRNRLQYFRVKVNGNLNDNDDINVTLKRIK